MTISAPLSLGGPHERPVARTNAEAWYSSWSAKSTQMHRTAEAFRTTQSAQTGITEHAVGRIPGYSPIMRLGSGSEADVYLYRQHVPNRKVAIKISKGSGDSDNTGDKGGGGPDDPQNPSNQGDSGDDED